MGIIRGGRFRYAEMNPAFLPAADNTNSGRCNRCIRSFIAGEMMLWFGINAVNSNLPAIGPGREVVYTPVILRSPILKAAF